MASLFLVGFTGDGVVAESRGQANLGPAAERFTAALQWHQKFPTKPLVFSGFSGRLVPEGASESRDRETIVGSIWRSIKPTFYSRIKAATPMKTPYYSYDLMAPTPGSHWILITSASHMPRAIGSFRAAGWSGILGYPVDYQTPETGYSRYWDIGHGTGLIGRALHEYAGLASLLA